MKEGLKESTQKAQTFMLCSHIYIVLGPQPTGSFHQTLKHPTQTKPQFIIQHSLFFFRRRSTLEPVMERTWGTPCASRRITPICVVRGSCRRGQVSGVAHWWFEAFSLPSSDRFVAITTPHAPRSYLRGREALLGELADVLLHVLGRALGPRRGRPLVGQRRGRHALPAGVHATHLVVWGWGCWGGLVRKHGVIDRLRTG